MKSLILCVCMLASLAGVSAAQGGKGKDARSRPDLSGTWVLDRSKSEYGDARGRDISKADSTLVITHRGPELRIVKTISAAGRQETKEYAYYTDGRGESNPMYYGPGRVESKTRWDGGEVEAYSRAVGVESTQKWRLSADGQTLTHTTVAGMQEFNWGSGGNDQPWHGSKIKLVYRRVG